MSADPDLMLVVFARAPIPGGAKSRLIPSLGAEGAALLQQRMTQRALETATAARIGAVSLWCTPSVEHPFFAACSAAYDVPLHQQCGADLGERLLHTHDRMFRTYRRVLVMGTDCPTLSVRDLRAARMELRHSDAVVIPADDGGYVLIGLAQPCPAVFRDIDWGSARVLAQSLARLQESGRSCRVRPALWDIDRAEDLTRLAAHLPDMVEGLHGFGPERG
jgi:rSAM/selenodomain-associated transferase 1